MSGGFDVKVDEVRAHATTVAGISGEVNAACTTAQASVSGDAYGVIGAFFAQAITAAGGQVREVLTKGAQSCVDVRDGLRAVADAYREVDDAQARTLNPDGSSTPGIVQAQFLSRSEPAPMGQRTKAVAVLEQIAKEVPISVAAVAVGPVRTAHSWVGNIASAQIGDHYQNDLGEVLRQPPTNANLRSMADTETAFWNSDRGNFIGSMMSADMRYDMLVGSRESWLADMPAAERARVAAQLGVRLGN